ncbi:hypothetical protein Tco_1172249 [Tanacetum coccineum]
MFSHRSNEDHVAQISKSSISNHNFPDNLGSRECGRYVKLMERWLTFIIPKRKSKAVNGLLPSIMIMLRKPYNLEGFAHTNVHAPSGPYATAVKGNTPLNVPITPSSSVPTLVLDDSCVIERDLSRHVKLSYLRGMWVMLEFYKVATKQKLLQHIGVNSWFQVLQDAVQYFVSDERVVFVDIEGIPLNVWSRSQLRDEDSEDDSDVDGVSETIFGDKPSSPNKCNGEMGEQQSDDPFSIYDILKRHPTSSARDSSSSFSHPPGFTPEMLETRKENDHVEEAINNEAEKVPTPLVNAKVMNNSQEVQENVDVMNNSNENRLTRMIIMFTVEVLFWD